MIEVVIDSIRISLISQHRIVMLRDIDGERQLPIWIGPCEAEAITIELQDVEIARPVTHDLLKNIISEMGGTVSHILINELKEQVYCLSPCRFFCECLRGILDRIDRDASHR